MIYPVYLARWYPRRPKNKKDYDASLHSNAKTSVEFTECHECGGKCTWKKSWGDHSIPWGYGDVWCSRKCLYTKRKKK